MLLPLLTFCQEKNMQNDLANLNKYALENEELIQQPNIGNRIIFMGDSITEFWKMNDSTFFSQNKYINRGISGQTTSQMVERFENDVLKLQPKKVVILAGINDIAENNGPISLEEIFQNIVSMIDMTNENKAEVILCSVLPANRFYWNTKILPGEKVVALNKMIQNYANSNKIKFVDYYSEMVDNSNGLQKHYGEDGVHPNLKGYLKMKSILEPYIK